MVKHAMPSMPSMKECPEQQIKQTPGVALVGRADAVLRRGYTALEHVDKKLAEYIGESDQPQMAVSETPDPTGLIGATMAKLEQIENIFDQIICLIASL